jgi:hypothetical protein
MQTSYKTKPDMYMLGLPTPNSLTEYITLMPTAVIQYGQAVKRGATAGTVAPIAVDGTTDKVVGVSVRRHNDAGQYAIAEEATIMTKGAIAVAVLATDTVAEGESAYMIVASTNFGKFTKTAGSNTVACGVFQSVKDNGLAVVKFDIVA